jgi:O-antigen/teichoic acid export membrane protein
MSTAGTILRNIASNWVGFAVNALVTLLLTPFVLHQLGASRYGIWAITASIIGYYGLLDFGVRGGINQFLTRLVAVRDFKGASSFMSTAVATLAGVASVCALLSIGAAFLAPQILHFPPDAVGEAFWAILIVGLTTAVQFALFPFMSVFVATQRFDLANIIGISTRLLSALLVYLALKGGYGLIGVSLATCGANILDYILRWRVARYLLPQIEISRRLMAKEPLKELASFGVWTFLLSLNTYFYRHGQPLVVGALMPIAAVGHLALAVGLIAQIIGVLAPIGQVMYPVAAGMHAQGNSEQLTRLYHDGSRLMMLVLICVVLIAGFYANDFYRLWIGETYQQASPYPPLPLLLQILLLSVFSTFVSNIGAQTLMGTGHVRPYALLLICGSALNLTLVILLIQPYGLVGVVAATAISSILIDLIAVPILLQRMTGLRVAAFLRWACPRPLAVGILFAFVLGALTHWSHPAHWLDLILQGAIAAAAGAALIVTLGITSVERQRLIVRPFARLIGKVAPAPR